MNNKIVWLEVDKTNQAILSYFVEQPTMPSDKFDYVQATKDELTYLSALEDAIFAPGTVTTLSDLEAHRSRVAAAKKIKATPTTKPVSKTTQKPSEDDSELGNTNQNTNNGNAKASLVSALRKHRSRK